MRREPGYASCGCAALLAHSRRRALPRPLVPSASGIIRDGCYVVVSGYCSCLDYSQRVLVGDSERRFVSAIGAMPASAARRSDARIGDKGTRGWQQLVLSSLLVSGAQAWRRAGRRAAQSM